MASSFWPVLAVSTSTAYSGSKPFKRRSQTPLWPWSNFTSSRPTFIPAIARCDIFILRWTAQCKPPTAFRTSSTARLSSAVPTANKDRLSISQPTKGVSTSTSQPAGEAAGSCDGFGNRNSINNYNTTQTDRPLADCQLWMEGRLAWFRTIHSQPDDNGLPGASNIAC